ncbi:twin-arginine translocase subunit TatC [Shewanella frigidimarina]|jgi:sec-independent protein translocase protein TatC|uniref:Sec-independent protein translocase protein TatC n=1 Tax=Shewanella frigidimarina (strain NCIMB 400) TaxID=318167 RepID=Q088I3_SHEFN|nr:MULTISPECIES: twin-arginine translocase subunit TatC [Shewanella]ABI70332.1 Sec-independent protein translocase TatC [Shewanella frigidimarina NCIMB 400]MBB1426007.1 twin-arginine translocase subunit TatC [Shewanella sp. SG44-2]PKI07066.1 twin-arginine translocase subunit TatC [Shewanella sp. 11B5]RPA28048.1 twin-arginine translocase subunit TatC [Shewanella frigidimarina]RPA60369.1 twin-arginine translocase subunit TatC [Shewanella frigidimarina]|tara:strand:+ start:1089 stop:1835 length:747 start_codon:yes stop_codon:yes gene_type:complete
MSQQQPLISHLLELRNKLLRAIGSVLLVFITIVYWANDIYHYIALPLMRSLPETGSMIATDVAAPFFAPFKLTLVLAFFIAIPYVLYQVWSFVAPGLYKHEKRLVVPLLASSTLLFYLGIAFAYYIVFPVVFGFFTSVVPDGVQVATDISSYLSFILKLFFAFGLAFEIPVAVVLLCWAGVTTPDELRQKRPYIVVGAFVVGMVLTPPDIISQTMLAVPMLLLFEGGLIAARFYSKKEDEPENEQAEN